MNVGDEIGVGIIGLGFMGRVHLRAYRDARQDGYRCRLVGVCDIQAERLTGRVGESAGNIADASGDEVLFDPKEVQTTSDPEPLLTNDRISLISICTPTDAHVDLAILAMEAGKHVLIEKPVAVDSDSVQRVADAARHANVLCMPALCMRFWPGWSWLKERIDDGVHGGVVSATFERLSSPPGWADEFYRNPSRTGGALVDLHIHDADFVRWCFGDPRSVVSTGTIDHLTTLYRYTENGPAHVIAQGGWNHHHSFDFRMRFVVNFEQATADFDFGRDPRLVLHRGGRSDPVSLDARPGYDLEIRHLLELVESPRDDHCKLRATIRDAVGVAKLLEAERQSLDTGREVQLHAE